MGIVEQGLGVLEEGAVPRYYQVVEGQRWRESVQRRVRLEGRGGPVGKRL